MYTWSAKREATPNTLSIAIALERRSVRNSTAITQGEHHATRLLTTEGHAPGYAALHGPSVM